MKIGITILATILMATIGSAQIDMRDSTVQSIAYWRMGESQKYQISESEITTVLEDTVSQTALVYTATVTVADSTSYGYLLSWTRSNYQIGDASSLSSKLKQILVDYPILISTDMYGSAPVVLNWEDIAAHVNTEATSLKKLYEGNEKAINDIDRVIKIHGSQEEINQRVIRDMLQLLAYHGAKYKLGEPVTTEDKIPNNYGGDPLDATTAMVLDEILPINNTYIVKTFQNINPQQLKAVTYDYLSRINIVEGALPDYEDFPTIMKQIYGGAEIHGPSGWVIYSQETEQVTSGEDVTTKERLIELLE